MAGLTQARITPSLSLPVSGVVPGLYNKPIADNVKIWAGAMVVIDNTGYARPGRGTSTDVPAGCAQDTVDNTISGHTAGALQVPIQRGVFAYDNYATHPCVVVGAGATLEGTYLYGVDDHTVSVNSGDGPFVGTFQGFDQDGTGQVYVAIPWGGTGPGSF